MKRQPPLRCPADRTILTSQTAAHVSFWTCGECGGIWLTRQALQRPLEPAMIPERSRRVDPERLRLRKIRVCPECSRHLVAERLQGIEIDRCEHCRGIWLDAGEYDAVWNHLEKPRPVRSQSEKEGGKPWVVVVEILVGLLELLP